MKKALIRLLPVVLAVGLSADPNLFSKADVPSANVVHPLDQAVLDFISSKKDVERGISRSLQPIVPAGFKARADIGKQAGFYLVRKF